MAYRSKKGVNDLVLLDTLSNDAINDCLQSHYKGDEIYTYIGQVLISVNPFKMISGLYSNMKKFKGKNEHQNVPHVYAIAERSYKDMINNLSRECVIITGESGSGKTEASKKIMEYIAGVSSNAKEVKRVKEQLLESNPLLEAFGNAKTIRNNNSSRFGKYMEIQFDVADPVGGHINVYLLEKNRVIGRQETERSFHIFYQLLAGATPSEEKEYSLMAADKYQYLAASKCYEVNGIDDASEYKDTMRAMQIIGLDTDVQNQIFQLVAAILHLGNVEFQTNTKRKNTISSISDMSALDTAAKVLGVSSSQLQKNLTTKQIKTVNEVIDSPLGMQEALYARDSLAAGIYGRLFDWIVKMANKSIHVDYYSNTIGVLDIYGFEIFGVNGFEQLCINYVNEKLHQLFIQLTLQSEQEEYKSEGIEWVQIKYYNNLPIVKLIESRGQIFSLLDEESIFPKGSDQTLYDKFATQLGYNDNFVGSGKGQFQIKHYAGSVEYSTEGFLEKNKDLMYPNLIQMTVSGGIPLLAELFAADAQKKSKKRPVTSCVQFKKQVSKLMSTLKSCNQHYIRCIKPNNVKRPNVYNVELCLEQIKYLGLLENVTVRRAGYAHRIPFTKFLAQYKACSKRHIYFTEDPKVATEGLLKELGLKDYALGLTKVFIQSPKTLFKMEDMRTKFRIDAQKRIPKDDQLIYADKIVSYDRKGEKNDLLFIISCMHAWIIHGKKVIHKITMEELQGISLGDEKDGFMVLHCQEPPPEKPKKNQKEPRVWDILVENVYATEVLNVVEVLRTSGVAIDVRRTDVIPESTDPNFKPMAGTEVKRAKCIIC